MRKKVELTQSALVFRLHRLGYCDVTERRIIDWRNKGLLPQFDRRGVGLGKGRGRTESTWTNGRSIVERAVWVHRLLAIYRHSDNLHLPLWMLGYPVDSEQVRLALLEPLERIAETFQTEAVEKIEIKEPFERKDGILEDYIEDLAEGWVRKEKFAELLGIPQEVVETAMNIFFNPDYDITDLGFEEGKGQLAIWKERVNNEMLPILSNGFDENRDAPKPMRPEGIELVFEQPGFFQDRLSVAALRESVLDASDEDLETIQEDLQVIRTVVGPMGEMVATLMKHAKIDRLPTLHDVLPDLFRIANLIVLVDLSMRRHGWSPQLNHARSELIMNFQQDFSEVTEEYLTEVGPELGVALKKGFKKLRKNWKSFISERAEVAL